MSKKLIMSVLLLLLMLLASLYTYFKFSNHSQISTTTQQSSSIEILPKKKIIKAVEDNHLLITVDDVSTIKPEINNSTDYKKTTKEVNSLEVFGTISNRDGEGLSDVLILANGEFAPVYSDIAGQFRLHIEKSIFSDLLIHFSRQGYEKLKVSISKSDFNDSPSIHRNVILTEALDTQTKTSVTGKVSNRIGEGIANQRIHLITLGDFSKTEVRFIEVAVTDENGKFSLNDVSINTYYQLVVLAGNGYESIEMNDLLVTEDMPEAEIIVEDVKLINLSGQVVNREGVPMPQLTLITKDISDSNAQNGFSQRLVTDDSGVFQLVNFPEGEVTFSIKSSADIEISGITLSEMNTQNLILTIDNGSHFVNGVVTDIDGITISDATVSLQSTYSKNDVDSHSVRYVKTDKSGTFNFEGFGADRHYIYISHPDFIHRRTVHEPHSSDTNLNIILERLE